MKKNKKVKCKLKLKNAFLFLLIMIVVGLSVFVVFDRPINNIYVVGNKYVKEQEILDLLGLDSYLKYYEISPRKMDKRLKTNPFIKDASVTKSLLSLTIEITEYLPLWYQEYDSNIHLSNNTNVYVESPLLGLPVLTNQVDSLYMDSFTKKMSLVDRDILSKISELAYSPNELDKERFLLLMNDQNYVYLTLSKFEYINKYDDLLPKLEGHKGILYLDSGNHFEIKK